MRCRSGRGEVGWDFFKKFFFLTPPLRRPPGGGRKGKHRQSCKRGRGPRRLPLTLALPAKEAGGRAFFSLSAAVIKRGPSSLTSSRSQC
jgi:hypothetical protein